MKIPDLTDAQRAEVLGDPQTSKGAVWRALGASTMPISRHDAAWHDDYLQGLAGLRDPDGREDLRWAFRAGAMESTIKGSLEDLDAALASLSPRSRARNDLQSAVNRLRKMLDDLATSERMREAELLARESAVAAPPARTPNLTVVPCAYGDGEPPEGYCGD